MNRPSSRMPGMQRRPGYPSAPASSRANDRGITVEITTQATGKSTAPRDNRDLPAVESRAVPVAADEVRAADCLASLPLAMAYVPWQGWGPVYEPRQALEQGTLFPQLDLPFQRGGRS